MAHDKPHILVVDDDDRLRALIIKYLGEQGFLVTAAEHAADARRKLGAFIFDLVILDVMMPGETGLELLASRDVHTPVLVLSAMGEAVDRINGLEVGAEDYLTKPFEPKELVLRIRAILRRTAVQKEQAALVQFGDLRFDLSSLHLKRGSEPIYLTSNEAAMLKLLAEQAGKPVAREALSALVPGGANERSVDVQMSRLRKKIEDSEGKPLYLQTVRGAGYVLYAQKVSA